MRDIITNIEERLFSKAREQLCSFSLNSTYPWVYGESCKFVPEPSVFLQDPHTLSILGRLCALFAAPLSLAFLVVPQGVLVVHRLNGLGAFSWNSCPRTCQLPSHVHTATPLQDQTPALMGTALDHALSPLVPEVGVLLTLLAHSMSSFSAPGLSLFYPTGDTCTHTHTPTHTLTQEMPFRPLPNS